jgi:hypothetical protein
MYNTPRKEKPKLKISSTTAENTTTSFFLGESNPFVGSNNSGVNDMDLFGLGSFSEVFITDKDLEESNEKLSKENIERERQQQIETFSNIRSWNCSFDKNNSHDFLEVEIGYNFVTFGHGILHIDSNNIVWEGCILNEDQNNEHLTIGWDRNSLSSIRLKCSDDFFLVQFIHKHDSHIQLSFANEENACSVHHHLISINNVVDPDISHNLLEIDEYEELIRLNDPKSEYQLELEAIQKEYEISIRKASQIKDHEIQMAKKKYLETENQLRLKLRQKQNDLMFNKKKDLLDCQICFEGKEEIILKPCLHSVCMNCATRIKSLSLKCPWDRGDLIFEE